MNAINSILLNFSEIRRRSTKLWEGIPEKHYHWKPDSEAMSVIEMVRHVLESEHLFHKIIQNRGNLGDYSSPWIGLEYSALKNELKTAEPHRKSFIEMIQGLSESDLESIRIERSEVGQSKLLGDYLNRIAYHESVHTGQLLTYAPLALTDPLFGTKHKLYIMDFNIDEVNHLIQTRRSIYPNMYTGEVIDDSIIKNLLENANWAPTHTMTEPWRFVIFKGEGLKKLAEFQSNLYKEKSIQTDTFDEVKFNKLATKPMKASHIISIGMKRCKRENIPEIEEIEAVACAVQNMYLTATAHGIGCYWGSGGVTYMEEAKSFFGLEEKDKLLGFMYLGIPKKWPEGRRKPVEEKVKWVQ